WHSTSIENDIGTSGEELELSLILRYVAIGVFIICWSDKRTTILLPFLNEQLRKKFTVKVIPIIDHISRLIRFPPEEWYYCLYYKVITCRKAKVCGHACRTNSWD